MDEIKPGEEVGVIEAWRSYHDEIEELKKVFFEFLKRWVDIDTSTVSDVNKPVLCRRLKSLDGHKAEPFRLSETDQSTRQDTRQMRTPIDKKSRFEANPMNQLLSN